MANKLFQKPKTIKEVRYEDGSLSKHNDKNGTKYLIFDPKNITAFECVKGVANPSEGENKLVYIKERLACMWGNEEIEEYVLVDKGSKDIFDSLCVEKVALAHKQDFIKAKVDDVIITYSHKKGAFSRFHYNVWFEYDDNYYYLYIKTCDGGKFKSLMEEFLTYKKTI
ncbi:MAG: hypothetical protein HFE31_04705 [Clostridia bacterium]|nr:hypothetical protein [Clostridia bacterium]